MTCIGMGQLDSVKQFHHILHRTVSLEHVLSHPHKYTQSAVGKLGVMLRRYSDECNCSGKLPPPVLSTLLPAL